MTQFERWGLFHIFPSLRISSHLLPFLVFLLFVALLDLSSFKCGHDAPTYGIIDKITSTAKVPFSALHDIDANKPGGSIQIRVKTYAHRLKLVEEQLQDQAQARAELARRVAEKRAELMAKHTSIDSPRLSAK